MMKAMKQQQTTYNALHLCLEAHYGTRRSTESSRREYREPEQGLRTVPFKSRLPLQLDYMRRRKNDSLIRSALHLINSHRNRAA